VNVFLFLLSETHPASLDGDFMIPQPERKFISHKDYLEMEEQAEYKSDITAKYLP